MLRAFLAEESGATIIEHGLIALGLSLAIVAAAGMLGATLDWLYGVSPAGNGFGERQQYGGGTATGI
jgi:Flp pilus assembly pilin Flp